MANQVAGISFILLVCSIVQQTSRRDEHGCKLVVNRRYCSLFLVYIMILMIVINKPHLTTHCT
jgi:hypothetical protein